MNMFCIVLAIACALGSAASISPTDPAYPSSVLAIQSTINLYPLAIDSKTFQALAKVFTQDAVANYSTGSVITGLPAIQGNLSELLAPVTSQHSLSTQVVDLLTDDSANAITYFTAQHFGSNAYYGQLYTAYGQYEDVLVKTGSGWKISSRQLVYMGPGSGNISIFDNTMST